jgi:hypothetical protein
MDDSGLGAVFGGAPGAGAAALESGAVGSTVP